MNLYSKSITGITLAAIGFSLLSGSPYYIGIESLSPAYAFQSKGIYLIYYALFSGALVGLLLRYIKGVIRKGYHPKSHHN